MYAQVRILGSLARRCVGAVTGQDYAVLTGTGYGRPGVAMARGVTPAPNGDPVTVVSAPEALLIANAKTSLEPWLATYKNAPSGDTVTAVGVVPAGNGDPLTTANTPVAVIVNADTLLEL